MEVRMFPNSARPGVGLKPRRESQRPLLPQHARHCPVLEAGSALGFLVFPPLEPFESFYIGYQGDGRYQFVYYMAPPGGEWSPIFTVTVSLPIGSLGIMKEDVEIINKEVPLSREQALQQQERDGREQIRQATAGVSAEDRANWEKEDRERFEQEEADYKEAVAQGQALPRDPNELVRLRLRQFLAQTADVDFKATLNAQKQFVKPEYESKPQIWKACYRAGALATAAARTFAQSWLKELGG